jgi:putative ABC transport system permease protein
MMGAVGLVVRHRLARHWRALTAAGLLLGLGFGLSLASFTAARRTASAYDRVLVEAAAPDAAIALGQPPVEPLEQSEQSLRAIDGITDQRVWAGFIGVADGVERILTTALIAPIRDQFPIERPKLVDGRLPRPDAPDEVFVNHSAAQRGDLEVGESLHFRFLNPQSASPTEVDVTIVGIGRLPPEAVADETAVVGLVVFTRAFYDAHRDLVMYAASNVDLASGFDARGDLAAAIRPLGYEIQSARFQERQATIEALRPIIIVLVALGILAFGATAIAASQVVQRNRDRWFSDSATLRTLGMAREQIRLVELATSAVIALLAAAIALLTMLLASPIAPVGPLHDLDPEQGFAFDGTVAAAGAAAVIASIALLTLVFSSTRRRAQRAPATHSPWLATLPRDPAAVAGLTLALRADNRRGRARGWRAVGASIAATAVLALCAAFVASAVDLTETPARYGFDADLIAVNPYGDQSASALEEAFAGRDDVAAATGYTFAPFLVNGRAVPGLATTTVKGELTPTLLRGRPPRLGNEIVLGEDSLDDVGANVGDVVQTQIGSPSGRGAQSPADEVGLRVVGVATFPPVNQIGTDMPRLGIGALVTRDAFLRMGGSAANGPEFTVVRMVDGATPATVIAANPDGFRDAAQSTTSWFTDAKPAELRQLDAALPYLRAALLVGFAILLAVIVHALWTLARSNRHDLAVLRALGSTRRQLDAVTAWQAAPFVLGAVVLGIPIGIALGRLAYSWFARSLAVVDDASTPIAVVVLLVAAVLLAAVVADLVAVAVARRSRAGAVLREG